MTVQDLRGTGVTLAIVCVMAAACGDGAAGSTTATTSVPTTTVTTTPPDTSTTTRAATTTTPVTVTTTSPTAAPTTSAATTTTAPATSTTADVFYSFAEHGEYPDLPGSMEYLGSGCSPGGGALPDGIWFGFARSLNASSIVFDLACLGIETDPVIEGFWVVTNDNSRVRVVPVAGSARVTCPGRAYCHDGMSYSEWMPNEIGNLERHPECAEWPGMGLCTPLWLFVNDGVVTEIVEPTLAG